MNNAEAREILLRELARYRDMSYVELCRMVDTDIVSVGRNGPSGSNYQIEIQVVWDSDEHGDVRVMGSIDDGGWRAFVPLCADFIKGRDR